MRRISNSEIQVWKDCRRRWYLQYRRRLVLRREDPTGPAAIGTRVHATLAAFYSGEFGGNPIETVHDYLVTCDRGNFPEFLDKINEEADLSRAILEGYFEWREETGADEGLTRMLPEQRLAYEILPGVELQGRIDVRLRREVDGARMVLDHKTVQEFTTPTRLLPLDEQMKTYMLLEWLNDTERSDGAIYNMMRKVKRTARAKPPFYQRVEVRHNEYVLGDFLQRVRAEIKDILWAEHADPRSMYPSPSRDCSWKCPFFGVCGMMDDPTVDAEGAIEMLFESGDPYARYEMSETGLS